MEFSCIINPCFDFLSKPTPPPKYITLCSVHGIKLFCFSPLHARLSGSLSLLCSLCVHPEDKLGVFCYSYSTINWLFIIHLLLLLPGAELSLTAESFGLLNDLLLPFLSILDASCPISDLHLQMSCLMLSSHLYLGLPCDLLVRGFQLNIFIYLLFDIPHHCFHMFPADVAWVVNVILLRKHKLLNRHTHEGTV
jgi:hypothetical protein